MGRKRAKPHFEELSEFADDHDSPTGRRPTAACKKYEGRKQVLRLIYTFMHISEGLLPISHAAGWAGAAVPFLAGSLRRIRRSIEEDRHQRWLLAASAGFLFALTALRLPSVAGSSSHATGVALGTVLLGPLVMTALSLIVLLFQALLTAHGGISTLGANVFSLGVVAPWVTYMLWRTALALRVPEGAALWIATALGSLATYMCTAFQLALAHPDLSGGVALAFWKFAGLFAVTQVPVAIVEAFFTAAAMRAFQRVKVPQTTGAVS